MQNNFRQKIINLLRTVQILYQNEQIDEEEKNLLSEYLRASLSNDSFSKEIVPLLTKIKRKVDVSFKDTVLDFITEVD